MNFCEKQNTRPTVVVAVFKVTKNFRKLILDTRPSVCPSKVKQSLERIDALAIGDLHTETFGLTSLRSKHEIHLV